MNDDTILGGTLNQLGQTAKKAVKQVVKIPEEMAQDTSGQVGGSKKPQENKAQENKPQGQWKSDEERVKFLRDLYGPAKKTSSTQPSVETSASAKASADKPEEQKKLMELRQQLHKQFYYDPTFNPQKNPPAGGEERPAEKVEKEKKMEALELEQKDKKKPPPLAVVREQNKAEMFRGAAG